MSNPAQERPWWRVPAMWLVVGGPALVVVASFATLALAVHDADQPVRDNASAPSAETMTPATQARNHVAAPRR
ncbi:MAG TPA: nitrogen fixation protein FixH [Burkholderiaceae bacterium]|nr:nitrogen fixation protein FixH [Burkholderiaceae bacterium]